ncbi:glycoside hydrolase family 99-like domain-containing protein [Microbacterium marinum]|uniref:glycosyltransferase WbsX family protein n=1 Tax=Microbacterium marinum TaxID=421115 RepID=UPI00384CA5D7
MGARARHHRDPFAAAAPLVSRCALRGQTSESGVKVDESTSTPDLPTSEDVRARALAFYLPQFFPIPENDQWWGPGFTEWTNTARARPLFRGHVQPTLPADLGFYDLRVPETRAAQAELAKAYGVEAFVYWHYWFGAGERILERPFREVLETGRPDIGFALAWANQTWTGIWHAAPNRVLKRQTYPGPEDDRAHFELLLPAFRDERYVRVGDRPLFYVFRPEELPDARVFVDRWQAMARAAGLDGLYLVAEQSDLLGRGPRYATAEADGFDAAVYMRLPAAITRASTLRMRARRKVYGGPEVWPYSDSIVDEFPQGSHLQPCVYPNWDNTPRAGKRGLVLTGSSPEKFEHNVSAAVSRLSDRPFDERLLWVKSWNEWAEGNHLEPDLRDGHGWLEALRSGLTGGR